MAAGQRSVPPGPPVVPHDAGERGVALEDVARLAVERDGGAQLVVAAQASAVHHAARVEARLPQLGWSRSELGAAGEQWGWGSRGITRQD